MTDVILISPRPLAGKTTIAAGLGSLPGGATLKRTGSDENASADGELLASLSSQGARHTIVEAAGGETAAESGSKIVVVAPGNMPVAEVSEYCKKAGSIEGVVANRVALKRAEKVRAAYESAGLTLLASVPEDRVLAGPVLRDVISALSAEASYLSNGADSAVIDNPVIASISADPGQGHFIRENPAAVIVRSDKPDLQLAALNAGAPVLIVTGGLPILSYVTERAEFEEIPLLRTLMDTVQTVNAIEELFGARPFSGAKDKLRRIRELLADSQLASLVA